LSVLYLVISFEQPVTDFLPAFLIIGVGFSFAAWMLTKNLSTPNHRSKIKYEYWILALLVLLIAVYIMHGGAFINKFLPKSWIDDPRTRDILIFLKKLFVFVAIPFCIYKLSGFSLQDFGLAKPGLKFFPKRSLLICILLSIAGVLFQLYFSNKGKLFINTHFTISQFLLGLPLCFIYLLFDAGLIEEFFFRGFLQSRLSVVTKSPVAGIVLSALIFGLVHAPGLYLRGAESEGIDEQLPFLFFASYTIAFMSIAGIFLGIIYYKAKNLWLVMTIHAMIDLIPNFKEFVHTWGIK
jgi:membrane protease YdiL (CAAX protease family)